MARTLDEIMADIEAQRELQKLKCPFCLREVQDEAFYAHVSYWGSEDGPKEAECEGCGSTFSVKERVERTFEVTPIKRGAQ